MSRFSRTLLIRTILIVAAVIVSAGCRTTYYVPDDLVALAHERPMPEQTVAEIAAERGDQHKRVYVRLAALRDLHPALDGYHVGYVRNNAVIAGGVLGALSAPLFLGAIGLMATRPDCSGVDFCGFGQAILGITLIGLGSTVALIGAITAIAGAARPPQERSAPARPHIDAAAGVLRF
jgi:hypothetical protein